MSRCQHCNKLTHSEDLFLEYNASDHAKVVELTRLDSWIPAYMYANESNFKLHEFGKLKCGDIWIHFSAKDAQYERGL